MDGKLLKKIIPEQDLPEDTELPVSKEGRIAIGILAKPEGYEKTPEVILIMEEKC